MARVTVEDCLKKIPNRFILANIAAKRTRQLADGATATIGGFNNKLAVLALREIEEGQVRVATEEELAQAEAELAAASAPAEETESKSASDSSDGDSDEKEKSSEAKE